MTLDPTVTNQEIINKLESVFGSLASAESVLQKIYTASQITDESITMWGLRIEEILQKAANKGHVTKDHRNDMLTKFWRYTAQN